MMCRRHGEEEKSFFACSSFQELFHRSSVVLHCRRLSTIRAAILHFFQFKSDDRWKTTGKHTFFTRMCSGKFEIRLNNGNFHTYVSDVMLRNRKFVKIVKLRCFLCWVREEGGRNDNRITLLLRLE